MVQNSSLISHIITKDNYVTWFLLNIILWLFYSIIKEIYQLYVLIKREQS